MEKKKKKTGNKTGCHGLRLHKGFSFRTHPFSSGWQLLIAERQSLPAKIKVKKKNKNKHAICFTHVVTLLPLLFLWWLFFLCLFVSCFFFFFFSPQQPEERVKLPWCVSAPVTPRWRRWRRWWWGWMAVVVGVDGGGWGPVTVTCNTTLIGVTSPGEGGCSVTLASFPSVSLTV